MASFNLANVFFFCLFVYIKSVYSTSESLVALQSTEGFLRYTFEEGVKCLGVEYDGKKILDLDPASQPKSVVFSVDGSTAFVDYGASFDALKLDGSDLTSVFSGEPTGRTVNVLYKKEGDNYECDRNGHVYTYTPKGNDLFSKVRYQPTKNSEVVLYEAKNKFEMATMVEYQEIDVKNMVVSAYCVDGLVRTFTMRNGGKWLAAPAKGSLDKISAGKVKFTVVCHTPEGVAFEKTARYLKYTLPEGLKCLGIEYEGKMLKFDPAKPLPKSVYLTAQADTAILNFEKSMDIFKMVGSGWSLELSGNPKSGVLDLSERKSSGSVKYVKVGKVHTFTATKGHAFHHIVKKTGLRRNEATVWHTDYFGSVVNKVEYDNSNEDFKVLKLHGVNGFVRTLANNGKGWKEVKPKDPKPELSEDKVEFVMRV